MFGGFQFYLSLKLLLIFYAKEKDLPVVWAKSSKLYNMSFASTWTACHARLTSQKRKWTLKKATVSSYVHFEEKHTYKPEKATLKNVLQSDLLCELTNI